MSINFNDPMNSEVMAKLQELFKNGTLPEPVAMDERRALFNDDPRLQQRTMIELANAAKQPVMFELNEEDEIKEMSDGTKYRVTPKGWKKMHKDSADCWCGPELDYVDPETGVSVYVHKRSN